MDKKAIPLGIKIICIILIFQVASAVINSLINTVMLKLPYETKTELIKLREFRTALNISTVEEFDKFCKMNAKIIFNPVNFSIIIVNLILLFGLLNLKKWARIMMIAFSSYAMVFTIWFLWNRLSQNLAQHSAKFISIILYCAIIIYLTRPKVKEQFK